MDKAEDNNQVSLPGAGETTEPTILEVLNRSLVGSDRGNHDDDPAPQHTDEVVQLDESTTNTGGRQPNIETKDPTNDNNISIGSIIEVSDLNKNSDIVESVLPLESDLIENNQDVPESESLSISKPIIDNLVQNNNLPTFSSEVKSNETEFDNKQNPTPTTNITNNIEDFIAEKPPLNCDLVQAKPTVISKKHNEEFIPEDIQLKFDIPDSDTCLLFPVQFDEPISVEFNVLPKNSKEEEEIISDFLNNNVKDNVVLNKHNGLGLDVNTDTKISSDLDIIEDKEQDNCQQNKELLTINVLPPTPIKEPNIALQQEENTKTLTDIHQSANALEEVQLSTERQIISDQPTQSSEQEIPSAKDLGLPAVEVLKQQTNDLVESLVTNALPEFDCNIIHLETYPFKDSAITECNPIKASIEDCVDEITHSENYLERNLKQKDNKAELKNTENTQEANQIQTSFLDVTPDHPQIENKILTTKVVETTESEKSEEQENGVTSTIVPKEKKLSAEELSREAQREYYQQLREYLQKEEDNRPPVPLQTYRWEDLRRAKQQGGYPWTHLYKGPLGPEQEQDIILLHRSQQIYRQPSESPRSLKKVRIHDQVLVKETERYIGDLSDPEDNPEEDRQSVQSEPTFVTPPTPNNKQAKTFKLRGILKRARPVILQKLDINLATSKKEPSESKSKQDDSPKKAKCCHPIMDKLKTMADKQLKKRQLKKVPLQENEKIVLEEEQKILKLKISPKAERSEIPHFVEKQDSDDILDIVILDESPSKARMRREQFASDKDKEHPDIPVPDEIIQLSQPADVEAREETPHPTPEPTVSEILEEEFKIGPPPKAPRKKKEHIYEDIDNEIDIKVNDIGAKIDEILEEAVVGALKRSLASQDQSIVQDMDTKSKHLDELGSSEEDHDKTINRLAPISSIDSATSDEEDRRVVSLAAVAEENDQVQDETMTQEETMEVLKIVEDHDKENLGQPELKSSLKREPSPLSDKKVSFSHVEDEAEPHREDIALPEEVIAVNRWSKMSDHEYEPIGEPMEESGTAQKQIVPSTSIAPAVQVSEPMDFQTSYVESTEHKTNDVPQHNGTIEDVSQISDRDSSVHDFQKDVEDRYFSSIPTTPRSDSRTDNEIHTSQVDSSALEELPLKSENRKKSFMASAQDRSRRVQQNLRSQAGKIRTKLSGMKKAPSGSPKAKDRRKFKAPEFSKMKLPQMKRPDMSKIKAPDMSKLKKPEFKKIEFKRPEFTKFSTSKFTKPDMSKFKIPDRFSSLRLSKSKSRKEADAELGIDSSETTPETSVSMKKKFDFNFGTYPRMLRKKKQKLSTQVIARADDMPSTETAPSFESARIPRTSREKGPISSRWADKFSDVSYGDSESGKYQRYGSEPESLERMDRDSSMERRMKDDMDRAAREEADLGIMGTVEQKQYADYDEENRAIHEISKIREGEFKQRRPMVHQDSDLVSEESKDVGWSNKDILRNKILTQAETDSDQMQDHENYQSDQEGFAESGTNTNQETQSTGSSGALRQKGVLEEIDDDEFFLRKRGLSEDNIEIRQYISTAIREGLATPMNALAKLGTSEEYYPGEMDISNDRVDYGYDIPPPKPKRVHKYNNFNQPADSTELSESFEVEGKDSYDDNVSLPQTETDYFKNIPPNRPLRKAKKQYSEDSQEEHEVPINELPYFEEEENLFYKRDDFSTMHQPQIITTYHDDDGETLEATTEPPKAPKRRKKQLRESVERDEYANSFSGRSISNSYIPDENQMEEIIVYRTEHEYNIPLAQVETFTVPVPTPRTRSRSQLSRQTDDDRTSHGAESLASDFQQIGAEEEKFHVEMKENDGYAIVRKEPPPRPPAPVRRKRSSNSFNARHSSTLPLRKKEEVITEIHKKDYSTMGPSRPPRRKITCLGDAEINVSSPDVTQYEELDNDFIDRNESPRDLQSGEIINKMKYRPLPPPPRPPRENRKHKNEFGDKQDKDGGGEKITSEIQRNGNYEVEKPTEKYIEVEVSTQTDPLPDDFVCEEFEITDDMRIIEPRITKTLEDILKEEQEAELERARQLADEEYLTRGIQRFREASQRSFSEKSKASTTDRPKSGSRPNTPSAIVIERRVATPIPHQSGPVFEASLIVLPVDDDYDEERQLDMYEHSEDKQEKERVEPEEEQLEEPIVIETVSQEEEKRLTPDRSFDQYAQSSIETDELELELPPNPPPRKRSSAHADAHFAIDEQDKQDKLKESSLLSVTESVEPAVQSLPVGRLTLADLEVDRLSVNALQAGRIMVSQLQGSHISAEELECKSGNLVVKNIELPPGFIEEIVQRVTEQAQAQTQSTEQKENSQPVTISKQTEDPPVRPPPPLFPSEYMQFSVPPPSFYQLRSPLEEEMQQSPSTHRRRRHHRRRDSSSDDEAQREHRRSRQSTRSPEPSIGQLGGQLLSACGSSVLRTMNQIVNLLRTSGKEGQERNISTAIVILILMTLGFLLLGMAGDKNIHHHHWDYFNPPGNDGRG